MNRRIAALAVVVLLAATVVGAQTAQSKPTGTFSTEKDKVSYAIGVDIGTNFKKQGIDINPEMFGKGLADSWVGGKLLLTEEEVRATLTAFQNELRQKAQDRAKVQAETNKKEGDAFLAANKNNPAVMTTASGLQYKVITEGKGPKPTPEDTVSVNYRGTLIDGTEFDSSYKRNQPATFPVKGVIPGWTEALQLMPVGSKWQLVIPANLAYGDRGAGAVIGPGAVLTFEVELLSIEKK